MAHTGEKEVRGRRHWRQSKGVQVGHQATFGLSYLCQAARQVHRILQRRNARCLRQGIDTPGRSGPPIALDRR